jgi:proteasome alpha subunit
MQIGQAAGGAKTSGYDRVATMFSPKGRLYQVEYASKIVEQGTIGIAIAYADGILFAADKHVTSTLVLPESIEKLFHVDGHLGAVSAGLVGDARRLVTLARQNAQENRMMYDEPIHVETLVKEISSIKQIFTQYAGMRPFGVSLIIGGLDDTGVRLFETEPSGALAEYKAVAIGKGKKQAMEVLERGYNEKISLENALKLAVAAIKASKDKDEKFDLRKVDVAHIEKGKTFHHLDLKKMKSMLGKSA